MTLRLRHDSIHSKLRAMNLLVSGTALLLACLAFITYDLNTFRTGLARNLSAQAQVIGLNSASALLFDDRKAAQTTLGALQGTPEIVWAAILTPTGDTFASFGVIPPGALAALPRIDPGEAQAFRAEGRRIVLVRSIVVNGRTIGSVCLEANLMDAARHAVQYGIIALVVMLMSLLLALGATSSLSRSITAPIRELARTAKTVSQERNYSVRATPSADRDELAVLVDTFNEMLTQIEQRDAALQRAHDELESRVQERTSQLVAANKEMEAFSYSVAHDLRGPLEAITNLGYILQATQDLQVNDEGRDLLRQLREATRRMADVIDDLLALSRATTKNLGKERLDLSAMARSIDAVLRLRFPGRSVEFSVQEGAMAEGDTGLIRIVLENLLGNAWKYTSRHGSARIEFGVETEGDRSVYFVRDDGAGFDQQSAGRLFSPFQRLHSANDFSGTGIGLATVKRIIQRHGGVVWAEGEVERGATFRFTL